MRWRGTIKDKQHEPTGRADIDVRRCFDCTVIAVARHLGEQDTGTHRVTVSAGDGSNKRNPHICCGTLEEVDADMVSLTVLPIFVDNGVCGLGPSIGQIGWVVDFNSEFLRVFFAAIWEVCLGVGTRDQDAAIGKEDRLGVIHAGNDGCAEF